MSLQTIFKFWIIPNIIPFELNQHWEIQIFFIISLGLLIGFGFQGLTKLARQSFLKTFSDKRNKLPKLFKRILQLIFPINLNEDIWEEITTDKDNCFLYKKACKNIDRILVPLKEKKLKKSKYRKVFYLMHNYLLARKFDFQPTWYTSRLAFWANTYFASYILLIICIGKIFNNNELVILVILFFTIWTMSGLLFFEYLRSMYDSILKTFVMVA